MFELRKDNLEIIYSRTGVQDRPKRIRIPIANTTKKKNKCDQFWRHAECVNDRGR